MSTPQPLDHTKVNEFLGRAIQDVAATFHAGLVLIGDRLGLYRAMAGAGGLTPAELAKRTGTHHRYVTEWLSAQAAGGYVTYDATTGRFTLPPEQAFVLLDADLPGAFMLGIGSVHDESKIADAFRTGDGVGWHEHDAEVFEGCERFFRPAYAMHLTSQWIPALEGVQTRLEAGARVADVGCGHGASTIIMAQAFPHSIFWGFDYHAKSIEWARRAAEKTGVADRVTFEVAPARSIPAPATTSSRSSTVSTTWAIRSARRGTCASRSLRAEPGCLWNQWPTTGSRTTSIRSGASTTARRRSSAHRPPSARKWASPSARRRARRAYARSSRTRGSAGSGAWPRLPRTWSSRRAPEAFRVERSTGQAGDSRPPVRTFRTISRSAGRRSDRPHGTVGAKDSLPIGPGVCAPKERQTHMLLKWGFITLAVAGVVGLVLGGALPDSCGTTATVRDEPGDLRDEAALAERLAALDAAIARQDLSRAVYEWRDAYGLALRARGWDAMAAVGDAAVRVDAVMGGPAGHVTGFRTEARRAYIHALLRAQREQSREGASRVADGFAALGDTDMAARARTLGTMR